MRRSFDKAAAQSNLNVDTAFAHGAQLSLGRTQSAKGGGEVLALRELIEMLDFVASPSRPMPCTASERPVT